MAINNKNLRERYILDNYFILIFLVSSRMHRKSVGTGGTIKFWPEAILQHRYSRFSRPYNKGGATD